MKKLLIWSGAVLFVLLLALVSIPFLFKEKIVSLVKEQANRSIQATLEFKDVDLSLIRQFPQLSIRLQDLSLVNKAPFDGDTLLAASSLGVTVDLMSVIKGDEIRIRSVALSDAFIQLQVDSTGLMNWDIAIPSTDTATTPPSATTFKAKLSSYALKNTRLIYDDRLLGFYFSMEGLDHEGSGDFTQDIFTLVTTTHANATTMRYGGIPYLSNVKTDLTASFEMDMPHMKFSFKENKAVLNDLPISVDGWVAMPDTNIDMSIRFSTPASDFKAFLSLVPALYAKDFSSLQSSGTLKLSGELKGTYNAVSMPGFSLDLGIQNGSFRYPSLSAAVKDIAVDLAIRNPDGVPDHTSIDLSRFHADISGDLLDARLSVRYPVSDPDLDVWLKGKLQLANVQKFYPLEKGTTLTGTFESDVAFKGRLSAAQQKDPSRFSASGNFNVTGMKYESATMPHPVDITTLRLSVSPQSIQMPALDLSIAGTDVQAEGKWDNVLGYVLKDETLSGQLNIKSKVIDLRPWMTPSAGDSVTSTDTAAMAVLELPKHIDFMLQASAGKVLYPDLDLANVHGVLRLNNQQLSMQEVAMELMGGSMQMSGSYSTVNPRSPSIDFALAVKDFDVQTVAKKFVTVKKMAPLVSYCSGKFGATLTVKGQLDGHMQPDLNSLSGGGKISTSKLVISDVPAFNKIADALKNPSWKRWEIPAVNPSFRFVNGRVYVDPFTAEVNGVKATIAGFNGFDQSIDYVMNVDIPRSSLGGTANSAIDQLVAKANAAAGTNVSVGEIIPVSITIKGTMTDPKVGTDLNRQGAKAMESLKEAAKAEFEKQKAAAEAAARAEADKLKNEAEARLAAEKAKAQVEAERMKKEAEARAKYVADSLKKAAEQEAKKAIDQFNPFKKK